MVASVEAERSLSCSICFEPFTQEDPVAQGTMCHVSSFHLPCLIGWVEIRATCPICREGITLIDNQFFANIHRKVVFKTGNIFRRIISRLNLTELRRELRGVFSSTRRVPRQPFPLAPVQFVRYTWIVVPTVGPPFRVEREPEGVTRASSRNPAAPPLPLHPFLQGGRVGERRQLPTILADPQNPTFEHF